MSCKVKTKEVVILGEVLRTVDEVLAANGKPSILYNRIKEYLVNAEGIDVSSDAANHKISKKAYDEYSKIYTKAYREIYGNWQSGPKAAVVELDENGEPTFEDFITELGDRYNKTNFIEYYMFKTPEGIQKGLDYVGSTNYKDYNELVLKESIDVGLIDYELRSKYYTAYEIGQIFTKHSNTGYKSPYYDFKAISADGKIVKSNTDSMLNIPAEYKEGRNFTILAVPKNVMYNPETKSFSADPTNSLLHKMTDKLKESNKGNYEIDFFNHISVDTKDMIEVLSDYYKDSNSTYFRLLNNLSKFVENDSKTLLTSPQFFKFNSDTEIATGMYRPFSKFITMSTHFDDDIQFKTFVHEVVHSITMNDSGINFKNIDAKYRRELQELYDYALQSNPKLKDDYGMHNLNEFMACCFNRPSFIQKLSKIRAKNPDRFNNLWEEVVGLLKRMFKVFNGMDRDSLSLYDEVLSVTLDFAEALKQDRIYTENMLSPYGEYIFEDDFPYDDVNKIENKSKIVEFNQNYKEEHSIIHSLLKYQKGQSKFPEEKIRLYLKLKQKEIKVLEDKATRKDINKRINQKLSRYKKSGKFSDKELSYKIIHAIEELNEYIESNGDKDELADVIAQLKVLSKAMIKKKAKKAKDVSDNTPLSSVINRDDMSPSPSGITPTENTDITEDEIIKGSLGANKKRLIELLGTKMYSGDIADVTVKELFQNSFDAIKQNKKAGNISRGKINIITNEIDRTITIEDNGSGMDADILANAFFTIGGTYKGNLDPSERSGGLGLAKMAILFSSENIKINTVKDGKEYIVNTTPEDISNDNFDIKVTDAKGKPNGTKISIKIPEKKISNVTGESVKISFPSEFSSIKSLKKYIVADNIDINVKHIREDYSGKIKTTDTTDRYKGLSEEVIKSLKPLFTVQTNWGEMEISYNPGDTLAYGSSSNVYILSSGIHQFTSYPLNRSIDNLGKDVIINIKPRVNSESAQYPFNNQREGFRSSASNDISNLQSILKMLNSKIGLSQVRDRFKSIHNLDKIDFDVSDKNIKVDYDLSPKSKRNYSEFLDETIKTIANKKGKGKIEISFSDKKTDEDVFTLKELTDEFESEKTDRSNLDSKRPVIHNNTNMVLEEDAIKFVVKFSSLLVDIKNDILESKGFLSKFGGNHPLSGKSIKDQFWGVSFDKDYSGVNVALDDEALLFINPFAHLSESVLENPRAEKIIAYTLRHIIFHELNHNFVRSEDASFTGHFPMVDAAAYALPNHDLMMMKLRELVADNLDTIKKYAARYKQSSNKESSLTGSSIQETDLGRPDRDTQDIERDDTSSFNERLLSDYNRLVRGTEVSDQINNFYQLQSDLKSKPIPELDNYLIKFLKDNFHVKTKEFDSLKERLGVNALGATDVMNKLIWYVKNRNEETVPEEVGHMIVMLMGANHPDIKELKANIKGWEEYQDVYDQYIDLYKDEEKVVIEAMGKLIAKSMVKNYKIAGVNKSLLKRILDAITKILSNPTISDAIIFHKHLADKIAINVLSGNKDYIREITNLNPNLDYDFEVKSNPFAKNIIDTFADKNSMLTGSLAVALYGENIRRERGKGIHDLDFVVKDMDHYNNVIVPNIEKLGGIPGHFGWTKDNSITYSFLIPKKGYKINVLSRKGGISNGFISAYELYDNKGNQVEPTQDNVMGLDFFVNTSGDSIDFKYSDTIRPASLVYGGKLSLGNKSPYFFDRDKDQEDYVLRDPKSFIPFENTIYYQLDTQSKQAILSPSDPRKLSSILSDVISNNNASEQLKSLATMLNDIVSGTPADTEVRLVREDVVRGTEDENAPEGISIMKMKGLAIPATNEAPARILINDRLNNAETISTIIHEGLHMATMAELSTNSAKAKKFKNFYEKAKRNIIENGYDANMYALSSPDEFLTAVFTDSNFREILSSTEPVRKKSEILNLLYEALDLIKSIIGFKGDISLLEDSLLMSTELLQGIKEGDNVNPSRHMYPDLDAMASVTTREFNSNFTDKQKAVKDKIDKVKEIERGRIYVDSKEFIDQLGKRAGKNIKLLSKVKDGMTRYIIWDEKQQKEVIVQNRPSDFGQLLFAKSKNFDKVRANKDNNDMSSVRRRGMGTTLHFIMEQLIGELDSQNSNMELLKPDFGNMGTWEDFYKLNKNDFIRKVLQSGKASDIFNIVYNTRSNGTYKYTIDQDDLIDPTDDAPTLSNEDRTFSVDEKDLEQLMRLAFKTYFNVYETQASMSWNSKGPIGRPLVMTEAPVYSDKKDIKGTIDLLVVYDNGKVGHFDWKFMGLKDAMKKQKYVSQDELQKQKITGYNPDRWGYTYVRRTVMDKLYVKRDTFEQQVATYKDILNTEFKINKGDIVQSRVIPVNMMFAEKPTGETYQFTNDQGKVVTVKKKEETNALQFIDHDYELLQSISLAKELTGDVLLDRFLTNLYKERDKLNARLKVQRGNENIRNSLRDVEDAIDSIVVKKNIAHVAEKIYNIANVISNNLSKPRYIDIRTGEGTKTIENPEYINDEDLNYFQNILIMYSDLMMSSENKIRQLTELSEMTEDADKKQQYLDESEELKEVLSNQYRVTTNVLKEINEERDRRLLRITEEGMYTGNSNSYIVTVDKNTMINSGIGLTDRVAKYSDTNVFYRYYTALSEISHPHLKLYKDLMDNLNYSVKEYVDNTSGKIEKGINGLKEWAKRNNKSMSEVYDLLVMYNEDKDDYMLLKPYTKELIQDTISAREDKNIEWLKKHMEFDKKKFNQARENYKKSYTKIYANKKDVDEKMQEFDEAYNPESSDYAYYNKNNRYLKYNEYALKQYKSSDYEYIMKQKELREFYNMYKNVMSDISNNLLTSGTYVDEYFIPNVRKDFIDKVVQDGVFKLDGLSGIKELIQRANDIRENDSEYGYQSNTEEVIDIIPLQFKDRIPGDLSLKSKDLGKSLLMFAYSSKMHQLSKDIEGISVGLKMSLATTKLMKKDMYGNIVIGSEVDADENTNLYKMLDGYINKYIYGRNLQELGEILGSKERTKWLMDLMSYQSKVSLAFNHLSLLGGHINAESQILTEAARGKHFTKKIWAESEKEVIKSSTKAVLAYEFFEVSAEGNSGLIYEKANKLSLSKLRSKYNKSLAYAGQRKSDDMIDKVYVTSMMKNYILHPNGKTIFPKQEAKLFTKGTEYEGREDELKTMWETMQVDESSDVEGLPMKIMRGDGKEEITKEQYIKFRNRIRSLASKAKGNYNSEDSYLYGTNLALRALMQYRGWIPAYVKERVGAAQYSSTTDDIEVGRYRVFLGNLIGEGLVPSIKKLMKLLPLYLGDLVTFNKFNLAQPSEDYLIKSFNTWANNNPGQYEELLNNFKEFDDPEAMAREKWKEAMQGQIKKTMVEVRNYLAMSAAALAIGFGVGEDELDDRPFVRELVNVINRAKMEIGFFFMPTEMLKLVQRSPLPVFSVLSDVVKLAGNSVEETKDFILGAEHNKTIDIFNISDKGMHLDFFEESSDRSPRFNYTFRAIPGVRGISQFLEFFESKDDDKTTIYEYLFGDDNTIYTR